MAQYPSAIKTFTTKVDQINVVYAADMNDVQSEITAIETTLGADLAITKTALDKGRRVDYGTVSNRLESMQANLDAPTINIYVPSLTRPSSSWANVNSWLIGTDALGYASASGIKTGDDGWWLIHANGWWDVSSAGYRVFALMFNNNEVLRDTRIASSTINTRMGHHFTCFTRVPTNTLVSVGVYQTSGSSLTLNQINMSAMFLKSFRGAVVSPGAPVTPG